MTQPQVAVTVRFRSRLSPDEVMAIVEERAPAFEALEGLVQKYYVHDAETGEFGGIYLWDSQEAFDAYRASSLRATIASAYHVEGEPRVEVTRVVKVLRPD